MCWERDGGERALKCPPGLPGPPRGDGAAGGLVPHSHAPLPRLPSCGARMEDAACPVPLGAAKSLPGRCHVRCDACSCLARSGEGGTEPWLPPVLGETGPRGLGCWHEAGVSSPGCRLGCTWRNAGGLVPCWRARRWVSAPGSETAPDTVLSAQHEAAVRAAPLGSGGTSRAGRCPRSGRLRTLGQERQQPRHPLRVPHVSHACLARSTHATLSSSLCCRTARPHPCCLHTRGAGPGARWEHAGSTCAHTRRLPVRPGHAAPPARPARPPGSLRGGGGPMGPLLRAAWVQPCLALPGEQRVSGRRGWVPPLRAAVGAGRMGPGDRYRAACRLRLRFPASVGGEGVGEPRGCRAPPGAGVMAAIRRDPHPHPGGLCWTGTGWPRQG